MRFEGQESSRYKETKGEKWNVVGVSILCHHSNIIKKKRKTKKKTIGTKACLKKTLKYKKWRSLYFSDDSGNGNQEIGLEKESFKGEGSRTQEREGNYKSRYTCNYTRWKADQIFDLNNIVKDSTCFTSWNKPSLLDVILVSHASFIGKSFNFNCGSSDVHNLIGFQLNINVPSNKPKWKKLQDCIDS